MSGKRASKGGKAPRTKVPAEEAKVKRHYKKDTSSFKTYIYKVLHQVHPDEGIGKLAMMTMDSCAKDLLHRIAHEAGRLTTSAKKQTLSSVAVQAAVRMILPGEIAKHAVSEGAKAVTKYASSMGQKRGEKPAGKKRHNPISATVRAGLQFSVGRVARMMKKWMVAKRYSKAAAVYAAAVVEYLCAEILELAGNSTRDNKKVRIRNRDIMLAVSMDGELMHLFKHVVIPQGGVMPGIHPFILPKKQRVQENGVWVHRKKSSKKSSKKRSKKSSKKGSKKSSKKSSKKGSKKGKKASKKRSSKKSSKKASKK